jgi:hypothetical protein
MSTMTSMPFSSSETASEHSSPRQSRRTHDDRVISNPHLQVLGRDGRDLPLFEEHHRDHYAVTSAARTTRNATPPNQNTAPPKKHWWTNIWHASTQAKEDGSIKTYASLDEAQAATTVTPTPTRSSLSHASSLSVRALLTDTTRTMASETARLSPTCSDAATSHYTSALEDEETEEDRLRQDCSFFYRNIDEPLGLISSSIKLPPQQQSAYRARYQQLNQDFLPPHEEDLELYEVTGDDDDDYDDDDAPLYPAMSNLSNSSLYYKQDGRVLMKLPRDKVRLVMDPEWGEPGILSAIVDRQSEDIFYILTVPPDLYKKVILDLASPSCFWETHDRISMHVAVLSLMAILFLLFVITLIYPGD